MDSLCRGEGERRVLPIMKQGGGVSKGFSPISARHVSSCGEEHAREEAGCVGSLVLKETCAC